MIFWEKILWEGESPYNGKLRVVEGRGVRRLVANGYIQSRTLAKDGKTGFYWDSFTKNLPVIGEKSKILLLGLGAGTVAEIFRKKFKLVEIHGVEIDPLIVELGKKFFYLDELDVEIFIKDAKKFVEEAQRSYNVICIDLFYGAKTPYFLTEKIFLEKARSLLVKDGVLIANKICNSLEEEEDFIKSFRKFFSNILVSRSKDGTSQWNTIIYCKI